jgi:hypothetical protein
MFVNLKDMNVIPHKVVLSSINKETVSCINVRPFGGAKEGECRGKRKSQGIGSVAACENMCNGELGLRMRSD